MATSRAELFAQSFVLRRMKRRAREWIQKFTSGFAVEDLRYAAEHNLNLVSTFLKPGEQKSRRKQAARWKYLIAGITIDDFIQLFDEVAPGHASVLRHHREWFAKQLEIGKQDIFGD